MKTTRIYGRFRQADMRPNPTDSRTLTIPDVVPTLKEIILSGSQQLVGQPVYDDSPEAGLQRLIVQSAPLEMILNAQLGDIDDTNERSEDTEEKKPEKHVEKLVEPAPTGETDKS